MRTATVELEDGRFLDLEIEEGVTESQIAEYVKSMSPEDMELLNKASNVPTTHNGEPRSENAIQNHKSSILDKLNRGIIGAGRFAQQAVDAVDREVQDFVPGMADVARGLGMVDSEGGDRVEDEGVGIGRAVGQAAPFVAGALAASRVPGLAGLPVVGHGVRAMSTLPGKIATGMGLGAAEGNIIERGTGGSEQDILESTLGAGAIGGAIEALSPLARHGKNLATKGYQAIVSKSDDAAAAVAPKAISKDDVIRERMARFDEQGIIGTKGDLTQDFTQQAQESRIASMATSDGGDKLRDVRLKQSEQFKSKVQGLVDSLGVPDEAGDSIKSALTNQNKLEKEEIRALYGAFAKSSKDVADFPMVTNNIAKAMPDDKRMMELSISHPEVAEKISLAMARFGVDTSDDALEFLASKKFKGKSLEAEPLTFGNYDNLRKLLGTIGADDITGNAKTITEPLRKAIDAEAEIIENQIRESGLVKGGALDMLTEGRKLSRENRAEFSKDAIVGKLIKKKSDNNTPMIEASRVARELLSPGKSGVNKIENLKATLSTLNKSGKEGKRAIRNLQSHVVYNALNDALQSPSRKAGGIELIGGNQFAKSLSMVGDKKLDMLFQSNPKALAKLRGFKQTALDITKTSDAVVKGSGASNLDIVNALPTAKVRDLVRFFQQRGTDAEVVRKAMKRPVFKEAAQELKNYPKLVTALGIPASMIEFKEEDN